jgi:MFS family permease
MKLTHLVNQYPRESWYFVAASFMNALGNSFMWPLTTLYVHHAFGRTFGEAGLVLFCQSTASIIGQFTGGVLYDRFGAKRLIVGSLFLGSVAQISLIGITGWSLYLMMMIVIGFLNALTMPAIQAFIGFRWKERRRELYNLIYVGNNIGLAIGASVAGLLASVFSFSLNFLANGITTLLFAGFFFLFVKQEPSEQRSALRQKQEIPDSTWKLLLNVKLYLYMALGSMLLWFSTSVWNAGIAPYLDERGLGMTAYSVLWTVNGIIIFAGQPVLGVIKRFIAKTLPSQIIASAVCYASGFALIAVSQRYGMIVIGMVITTFGEMLIAPAIPAFISEKAGRHAAYYLGIVGAISTFGRIMGPYILGTLYDHEGILPVLLIATLGPLASVLLYAVHASLHRESRLNGKVASLEVLK